MLTVTRAPKGEGDTFARILNATLQDRRLSFRARGVLALVLSLPSTWRHSAESLAAASPDGVKAVLSALRELEAAGYSNLLKLRAPAGTVSHCRTFSETPTHPKPADGKPTTAKGETANRPTQNRPVGKGGVLETTVKKRRTPLPPEGEAGAEIIQAIYQAYPRRLEPLKAADAIAKAIAGLRRTDTHPDPAAFLLERTRAFAAAIATWPHRQRYKDGRDIVPYPATWFERGRYGDDPSEWQPVRENTGEPEIIWTN